ncbi:regulator of chromosome condensation 1/beta-lactamase-inhibitor protein II [Xylariaceae sp. FL0662B]|nr:regulator of chromosome condensation 1/beta-lactamase-inhibitor protein II [Xylariaceae sp. FL0662B]
MNGLFALGSNGSGQLGIGHREDVSVPKQVQFASSPPSSFSDEDEITKVAAGGNHTISLTSAGRAYWSGELCRGASGTEFRELVFPAAEDGKPPGPVAYAACTWTSSVLVLRDERGRATRVYVCGGVDGADRTEQTATPAGTPTTLLADFPPPDAEVIDLAAGFRHVVAVLDDGSVYGWGQGRKGQLGGSSPCDGDTNNNNNNIIRRPRRIDDIGFKVAKAVCCQHATCVMAEPGDGRVLVLGADKWGLRSDAPAEVPDWKAVRASWGGVYVLRRNGRLVAWGRDDHGQLPPAGLPALVDVAAGSEHVLALTEEGDVLAWGWGEHGNCGPRTDGKCGDVRGRWNVLASVKHLPEGTRITMIGAGCATSWISIAIDGIFL